MAAPARFRTYGFPFAAPKRLESFGEMLSDAFRRRMRIPEIDYNAWSYALRSASAASLALYISLSLNLDESGWAFTTCYIVGAQRLSGQILARSVARVIGTVVGATASFVLVNAFAQERVLFIGCLAAWLSVCAFFSHYQRGQWAYAWVLSGFTMAIVGIPAALTPDSAFDVISSRAENIIIGILCMGMVSMIAFPESVRSLMIKQVKTTDRQLLQLLSACLSHKGDSSNLNRALRKVTANAVSIENFRHGFAFEETGTGFSRGNLGRFHLECLEVANAAVNLDTLLFSARLSLENGELPCLSGALDRSRKALMASVRRVQDGRSRAFYDRLNRELKELQTSTYFAEVRYGELKEVELVGIVKVRRLLQCLINYLETKSVLCTEAPATRPPLAAKIAAPIDTGAAAIAVLRVFVTVGLAALFWIGTAWPAGSTFLTWVGVVSCRFVIEPSPSRSTEALFRGMLIAAGPAYLITFYVMPRMDGFAMFVLALFPFVFLGTGIGTSLGRPIEVVAGIILLMSGLDPANEMKYDVLAFLNGVLATILGVGTMCVTHRLLFPSRANQRKAAVTGRLRQSIARSIGQAKVTSLEYLGSVARTLTDVLSPSAQGEELDRNRAEWGIDLCALGYEIVTLQNVCGYVSARLVYYQRELVQEIAGLLQEPSGVRLLAAQGVSEKAYNSCLRALASLEPDRPSADRIASSLASFATIRQWLNQQQHSVLRGVGPAPLST